MVGSIYGVFQTIFHRTAAINERAFSWIVICLGVLHFVVQPMSLLTMVLSVFFGLIVGISRTHRDHGRCAVDRVDLWLLKRSRDPFAGRRFIGAISVDASPPF